MTKNTRFSPEVRQRAIRMVLESQDEYDSQWAAICSIAPKIGCTPETLRVWVRQHERDVITAPGYTKYRKRQRSTVLTLTIHGTLRQFYGSFWI